MEHRKLLPRPESHATDRQAGPSSNPPGTLAGLVPRRKKAGGRFACDFCRSRKSAVAVSEVIRRAPPRDMPRGCVSTLCDGQRPTCSTCRAKRSDCTYKERDKIRLDDTSAGLLNLLRTSSQDESLELLQKLRATAEPPSLPSPALERSERYHHAHTPDRSSRHVSELPLATRATGIELELMARYPIAYPCLCPVEVDSALFAGPPTTAANSKEASMSPTTSREVQMEGAQTYCDPRLSQVDFRSWTTVSIDNSLAAGAVSHYLETDHPIHGLFDADLFLHDLGNGENNFCSPTLVNAILGWACQSYSAVEAAAAEYQDDFFHEATRLWEGEEHQNTLTGVAAAHLLSMTAICQGKDDVADQCLREAVAMGRRMGLHGAVEEASAKTWLDNHQSWIRAASHTAWGGYCSATHHYLHYQTPVVERPPFLPIPGELGAVVARSKSERYESYPMSRDIGQTFNKLCELFRIAHRLLWAYYDGAGREDSTPIKRVTLPFAEQLSRELLEWSVSLPLDLVRADGNPHHTVLLHMYFHCLVSDIFRPFLDKAVVLPLKSFEAGHDPGSVGIVYKASVDQLKRLVIFYLSKYTVAANSALWRPALIHVLNSLIRDARLSPEPKDTREWNFYFRTCMLGLVKQLPYFPVTDRVIQGILSMAVRDGIMSTSEASNMLEEMRREAGTEGRADKMTGSTGDNSFIVDLDLAMNNPSEATVDVLVNEFDRLAMLADAASTVMEDDA